MAVSADGEGYQQAELVAQELRENVADQIHDLIVERLTMGSEAELVCLLREVGTFGRQVREAQGRQLQARTVGAAVGPHATAEREARAILRGAVVRLAAAAGALAVKMDFDQRQAESG